MAKAESGKSAKVVGLFKNYDYHHLESLETPLEEMKSFVNYWLTKFVQFMVVLCH